MVNSLGCCSCFRRRRRCFGTSGRGKSSAPRAPLPLLPSCCCTTAEKHASSNPLSTHVVVQLRHNLTQPGGQARAFAPKPTSARGCTAAPRRRCSARLQQGRRERISRAWSAETTKTTPIGRSTPCAAALARRSARPPCLRAQRRADPARPMCQHHAARLRMREARPCVVPRRLARSTATAFAPLALLQDHGHKCASMGRLERMRRGAWRWAGTAGAPAAAPCAQARCPSSFASNAEILTCQNTCSMQDEYSASAAMHKAIIAGPRPPRPLPPLRGRSAGAPAACPAPGSGGRCRS